MISIDSRYLEERETQAGKDFRAFRKLTKHIGDQTPIARGREREALRELRGRGFYYRDIWTAVAWLLERGTFPDLRRCLYPLAWLAAGADRFQSVLHRAAAEIARKHLEDWRRELISQRELEQKRAEKETAAAFDRFRSEYPTEPERRRAMIRVFNLHREKFGPLTLAAPAAQSLCVALLFFELEALEIVRDRSKLAG